MSEHEGPAHSGLCSAAMRKNERITVTVPRQDLQAIAAARSEQGKRDALAVLTFC
jgi:predicted DNA binding CopG/RHH family protein